MVVTTAFDNVVQAVYQFVKVVENLRVPPRKVTNIAKSTRSKEIKFSPIAMGSFYIL